MRLQRKNKIWKWYNLGRILRVGRGRGRGVRMMATGRVRRGLGRNGTVGRERNVISLICVWQIKDRSLSVVFAPGKKSTIAALGLVAVACTYRSLHPIKTIGDGGAAVAPTVLLLHHFSLLPLTPETPAARNVFLFLFRFLLCALSSSNSNACMDVSTIQPSFSSLLDNSFGRMYINIHSCMPGASPWKLWRVPLTEGRFIGPPPQVFRASIKWCYLVNLVITH